MDKFILYKYTYLYSVPFFLLTLVLFPLGPLYAILYFGATMLLIFQKKTIDRFRSSSAADHFQINSRWNTFTYAIAAYLVFSAIVYMSIDVFNKAPVVFILWTIIVVAFQYLIPRFLPKLHRNLIISYVNEQTPDIDDELVKALIEIRMHNQDLTSGQIAEKWNLDQSMVENIFYYYNVYLERNNQVFSFIPMIGDQIKQITTGNKDTNQTTPESSKED